MNAFSEEKCRRCGAVLSRRSAEGLCPACLMSVALEPADDEAATVLIPTTDDPRAETAPDAPKRFRAEDPSSSTELRAAPRTGEPSEFPCRFGNYRLLGFLGRGGMGSVYEAEHLETGRRVALKMLGEQIDSPVMRQRFLREGRLAAGVNHPNSLYVFGSEEIEGTPVITMEIAGSGTLHDRLEKRGPMPVPEAVDAILDVISGLESACARGVLHRDIKPSNCFVYPDGSVKVGDFGLSVSTLAKTDTFVTATGTIMGTPAYASPEQLRGDVLDLRADIYSVGATLFTLLTNRAPFTGDNAVQVVANAVNQKPPPLSQFRTDIPPGLEQVIERCLAKEPEGRYPDYAALRNDLLPFSSREPEPASLKIRVSAGWLDYLIAFLVPYVAFMLWVGPVELLIRPVVEPSLYSARYYLALFGLGFLYFALAEGVWGGGPGKRLKGLRVVRPNGRVPGVGRALVRILVPILSAEGVRMPLMIYFFQGAEMTGTQNALFTLAANACPWIPVLLTLTARRENGFATVWDFLSGTRVVVKPKGTLRPSVKVSEHSWCPLENALSLGPYQVTDELIPGEWLIAGDPILRRDVWLIRQDDAPPSLTRRDTARPGRFRWLQKISTADATWHAYEATRGVPLRELIKDGRRIPWSSLRHWLHDLASELWDASRDKTLPPAISLDHVWITEQGFAVLLDRPWPRVDRPAEAIPATDLAGRQRFLKVVAECADTTSLPLHARRVLQNLAEGKFEKLSFLTGTLRGLLDRPAEMNRAIRAASIFLMPSYIWVLVFVGLFQDFQKIQVWSGSLGTFVAFSLLGVLAGIALIQLIEVPFRTTVSQNIFRLAVIDRTGHLARRSKLLLRWAFAWLPLVPFLILVTMWIGNETMTPALILSVALVLVWIGGAIYATLRPCRGLPDRFAGTWVVRR
ncbi:MAG: protein kinase [Acidobacteriota bacterium]